eukprot:406367_1
MANQGDAAPPAYGNQGNVQYGQPPQYAPQQQYGQPPQQQYGQPPQQQRVVYSEQYGQPQQPIQYVVATTTTVPSGKYQCAQCTLANDIGIDRCIAC